MYVGFWTWLCKWKWTVRAIAYMFCILLLSFFIPAYVQMTIEKLPFGVGVLIYMTLVIPATLYGFYRWGERFELRPNMAKYYDGH